MGICLALMVCAYLLGSVPFGVVVARLACGIDPRTGGSHSIGATNVSRLCGFGYGVLTLALDLGKGTVPVLLALSFEQTPTVVSLVGACAVLGHVFPCFLSFRGGKAVATTIGVFLPLAFFPLLASSLLCLLEIWLSGFVSLGSLTLLASLPLFLMVAQTWHWVPLAVFLAVLVFWKHKDNVGRLLRGEEKSWLKGRFEKTKEAVVSEHADAHTDGSTQK